MDSENVAMEGADTTAPDIQATTTEQVDSAPETNASETQEKMLSQSEVNKMIGHIKDDVSRKAYEKARAEFESKQPQAVGGQKAPTQEDIQRMIDEGVEKRAQQEQVERLVNEFTQKVKAGSAKYDDFDSVVSELNLASNPHLVRWANGLDNTADVLYDLGKYPEKYASVMTLAGTAPGLAVRKLQELSDSIKRNEEAKSAKRADQPLDNLEPTDTGMDNGSMTVSDYRKVDWLRG